MSEQVAAPSSPIAVIGLAGRFPGANGVAEFWDNLIGGVESITFFDEDELRAAGITETSLADPNYIRANPVIDRADEFDAGYFGIGPREAEIMDPQIRVMLEVAAEALHHGGYDPRRVPGRVGIFAGAARNEYLTDHIHATPGLIEKAGTLVGALNNDTDYVATNIAYRLNLRGPAVSLVTACSTSMVAIHFAAKSLQRGECEVALAGGVEIRLPLVSGYPYAEGSIFSADGRVRAFDAAANGTVFGAGAALVLLKPLDAALADGDTVHGVLRGSAVNNDGSDKSAFSAPSPRGQEAAIRAALADAGVDPETIGYVEAHGTGTAVGDPLELEALATAYGGPMGRPGRCAISSVKSNVGHLGAAAGVTGFIKALHCVRTGLLPPIINVQTANPALDLEHGMFRINDALDTWSAAPGTDQRRAGVSSFGIGGTNAHVILEEPPHQPPSPPGPRRLELIPLSARTRSALDAATGRLGTELAGRSDLPLADVAFTLATGRAEHAVRRVLVVGDTTGAATLCADAERLPAEQATGPRRATLLFPGQGAQYPNMGRDLYEGDPVFRATVLDCTDQLSARHGIDLLDLLYGDALTNDDAAERLARTEFTQPALFVVEYATARMLSSWGVDIADMAGHSIGEYVAATMAGVFALSDALDLVVDRGRLMQSMPTGSMLAVSLPEDLLRPLLPDTLDIAAVNAPDLIVVSGPDAEIESFGALLATLGSTARPVRTSHAFHSRMMEPILDTFRARVAAVPLTAPAVPFVSNLTGTWITDDEATDPDYWVRHLRGCVRFGDDLALLTAQPGRLLIEAGPGRTLTTLAGSVDASAAAVLPVLRVAQQHRDDLEVALTAFGAYWARGGVVDWPTHFAGQRRRRVPLPGYPYERTRYWVDPPAVQSWPTGTAQTDGSPFSMPTWTQVPSVPIGETEAVALTGRVYVVLAPAQPSTLDGAVDRLRAAGARVLLARAGSEPSAPGPDTWIVEPDAPDQLAPVLAAAAGLAAISEDGTVRLVHAWALGDRPADHSEAEHAETWIDLGFVSCLALLQQAARRLRGPYELTVVTSGMQQVTGRCRTEPAKAALVGLVRTVVKEFEALERVHSVDLDLVGTHRDRVREADQLLACLVRPDTDAAEPYGPFEAMRGGQRWRMSHTELTLDDAAGVPDLLVDHGTYVITGGLGGLGLALAGYLGGLIGARLVLLGRSELPDRDGWERLLHERAADDALRAKIEGVLAAEAAGAEIVVMSADVTDRVGLERVRARAEERFGPVDGVFHLAALPGGSMLETRDLDAARAVFRPKVQGVYQLQEVFRPSLLVAFSSIAALSGDFGLGDYSAANAVVDAYAQARWAEGLDVLSINLPPWGEVGMAFSIDPPVELGELSKGEQVELVDHPLLTRKVARAGGGLAYGINLSHRGWVLADHLMSSIPTMPGTGIVELLRAAAVDATGERRVEISDLVIARPLMAEPGVSARLELRPAEEGVFVAAIVAGREASTMVEYATARVRALPGDPPPDVDLDAIRVACPQTVPADAVVQTGVDFGPLRFGPHWGNLVEVHRSSDTELVESRIPDELAHDHDAYGLNPAQLDICVAVGQTLGHDGGHLPFAYDRIGVFGDIGRHCYSIITHHPDLSEGQSSADIIVTDETGRVLVDVRRLTMLAIDSAGSALAPAAPRAAMEREPVDVAQLLPDGQSEVYTAEGLEGLRRILLTVPGPQVVWAAEGVRTRVEASSRVDRTAVTEAQTISIGASGQRPLPTPAVPATTPSEIAVCELWREALGLDEVGIEDDFFDLGGNSLTAVQLVSRISDRFHTRLAVFELFDARTPRVLAEQIDTKLLEQVLAMSETEAELALARLDADR